MSSGLECEFVQTKAQEWFYLLQDWNAPAQCWDWREHATAYGPFVDQEQAEAHLAQNHANPGGWGAVELRAGEREATLDEAVAKAIEEARSRQPSDRRRQAMRGW